MISDGYIVRYPILFMVFNRPRQTKQVFDVIKSVKPNKLYIQQDAPRKGNLTDIDKCKEVKEIITDIDWDCEVKYSFPKSNLGCALAGKTAWDWIFEYENEMIFIEDDGLVSLSFFQFCDELLNQYRNDMRIAYIGGVNYGVKQGSASYFFSRTGSGTYAMATWKRVHELYEFDLGSLTDKRLQKDIKKNYVSSFVRIYMYNLYNKFKLYGGNTYDLQMVYLVNRYNMLNIVPNVNMCTNIGFGEDASNTSSLNIPMNYLNRERFELREVIHPKHIGMDSSFERKYFRYRVFLGDVKFNKLLQYYYSVTRQRVKTLVKNLVRDYARRK